MSVAEGEALLQQLETHYGDYAAGKGLRPAKRGILRTLKHWFSYDVRDIAPEHERFLTEIDRLVNELTCLLSGLPPEERKAGSELAARCVELLLQPKVKQPENDRQWYLMVAEYSAAPLLPFLEQEELRRHRNAMLAHTSRRMMYPKQLELLDGMETLLTQR